MRSIPNHNSILKSFQSWSSGASCQVPTHYGVLPVIHLSLLATQVAKYQHTYGMLPVIMSHSLLWRHIVLLTVSVYSSNHRVLYTIVISMTRRSQKSVGPSVCPFVTLTKKPTPHSLLTVEK